MTQNRGRGLASQPIPPHKIKGDSTLAQRTDRIIDNAKAMGGRPSERPPMAPPDAASRNRNAAGPRTSSQWESDRRLAQAQADSVLKGKRKN